MGTGDSVGVAEDEGEDVGTNSAEGCSEGIVVILGSDESVGSLDNSSSLLSQLGDGSAEGSTVIVGPNETLGASSSEG